MFWSVIESVSNMEVCKFEIDPVLYYILNTKLVLLRRFQFDSQVSEQHFAVIKEPLWIDNRG